MDLLSSDRGRDILLISDEVMAGFGRTATTFGVEHDDMPSTGGRA